MNKKYEFIDAEDVNKRVKNETEQKIEDYIENIPDGKVSTIEFLAKYLGIGERHLRDVLKNRFSNNIKKSSITRKSYVGKPDTLEYIK